MDVWLSSSSEVLTAYEVIISRDTCTTEFYTLSLHDALPIWQMTFSRGSRPNLTVLDFGDRFYETYQKLAGDAPLALVPICLTGARTGARKEGGQPGGRAAESACPRSAASPTWKGRRAPKISG